MNGKVLLKSSCSMLLVMVSGFVFLGWKGEGMERRLMRETEPLGLSRSAPGPEIGEADLVGKPQAAQRYFRVMGVLGRPRDVSFRAHFSGMFRLGPDKKWMPSEIVQFSSRPDTARIFHMRCQYLGPLHFLARDTYVGGKGRMLGKLMDLVTVVDGKGEELDIGELVTYLNDAVLFAPSFLFDPKITYREVDSGSFDVSLTDAGRTVTGRVFVDERGVPYDFSTTDRFLANLEDPNGPMTRAEWRTPVEGFRVVGGRGQFSRGKGVWMLESGPYVYADFQFADDAFEFNVPPVR